MEEIVLKYSSDKELKFSTKSCSILGANGTGKSSFSRKIIQLNNSGNIIQPISAQRNLTFKQGSLKGEQDDSLSEKTFSFNNRINGKLGKSHSGLFFQENSYNNLIQDDFNENIEKLYREHINKHAFSSMKHNTGEYIRPLTNADTIFSIWNHIFIKKSIEFDEDGKIKVVYKNNQNDTIKYEIENLSDGERSALYLITKCIYAPENGIIVVDEGETHLNSALLHDLWNNIEEARQDCRFVYISHNIDFITSRSDCTNFWIKDFNHPGDWEIEKIENDNLPEELILQIIGSKKEKILFVESKENKDRLFYQKIYSDFKIIPLDSCENVVNFTKVLNQSQQNYNKSYYGLIDRDFRTEENIQSLKENNIFSLPVAEFENLFFKENVVKFIFDFLGKQDEFNEKFGKLKEDIFSLKDDLIFKKDFYKNFIHQKFNQNLESFEIGQGFEFKNDYSEINQLWDNIIKETDYDNFLKLLNAKSIKGKVSNLDLGYRWKDYYKQILDVFNTDKKDQFKAEFLNFMPNILNI